MQASFGSNAEGHAEGHAAAKAGLAEALAIVGMGGVFPGAASLADFWRLVEAGQDTCREVPAGRWQLDPGQIRSAVQCAPDSVFTGRGCYIEGFAADLSAIKLPHEVAATLDPAFHLLIAAGHGAYAQAKTGLLDRSRVGVIIGSIALPTAGSSALCDEVLAPLFEQKLFHQANSESTAQPKAQRKTLESNPLNRYVTGLPAALLARSLGLGGAS